MLNVAILYFYNPIAREDQIKQFFWHTLLNLGVIYKQRKHSFVPIAMNTIKFRKVSSQCSSIPHQ